MTLTNSEEFNEWWERESCGNISLLDIFKAGWAVGYRRSQSSSMLREELILDEFRKCMDDVNEVDKIVVKALTEGRITND